MRQLLACACMLLLSPGVGLASEAGRLAKEAEIALAAGEYGSAVALLRRATELEPGKRKFRDALDDALQAGAAAAVHSGLALPRSKLSERARLAEIASEWWPHIQGLGQLRAEIADEIGRGQQIVETALVAARSGDHASAQQLVDGLDPHVQALPAVPPMVTEITAHRLAEESKAALDTGDAAQAFRLARDSLELLPGGPVAAPVFRKAVVALAAEPAQRAMQPDSSLQDLLNAAKIVAAGRDHCPDCAEVEAVEAQLAIEYSNRTITVAKGYERVALPFGPSASCAVLRSAADQWRGGALDFGSYQCEDPHLSLKVGLVWANHDTCPVQVSSTKQLLAFLPRNSSLLLLRPDRSDWKQADVVLEVKDLRCSGWRVEPRSIEIIPSRFVASTARRDNPRYLELIESLRDQRERVRQLELEAQRNPNAQYALLGAQIGLFGIQRALKRTPAFIEEPLDVPYEFEKYEAAVLGEATAELSVIDAQGMKVLARKRVVGSFETSDWGRRGVRPEDSQGHTNLEAKLLRTEEDAARRAWAAFKEELEAEINRGLAGWLLYRAVDAADQGKMAEAAAIMITAPPDVLAATDTPMRMQWKNLMANPLKTPNSLHADILAMRPFAPTEAPTGRDLGASRARASEMLEGAMDGVVQILTNTASGSGFFIDPNGLILTNHHLIEGASRILVATRKGEAFVAQVLREDPARDLALLRVEKQGNTFLLLSSSHIVRVGDPVYSIGNPNEQSWTVTKGIIGAVRDVAGTRVLQSDAAINPGNSGGPLVLEDGRVVAIVSWKRRDSEALGFAVAIEEAGRAFGDQVARLVRP